jgi:hypothetical protein
MQCARMPTSLPPGQRLLDEFPRFGVASFARRKIDTREARLEFSGPLARPVVVTAHELARLQRVTVTLDFHCAAGWSYRALRWSGFRFIDVRPGAQLCDPARPRRLSNGAAARRPARAGCPGCRSPERSTVDRRARRAHQTHRAGTLRVQECETSGQHRAATRRSRLSSASAATAGPPAGTRSVGRAWAISARMVSAPGIPPPHSTDHPQAEANQPMTQP